MSGSEIAYGVAALAASGLSYKASTDATNEQKKIIQRAGQTAQEITGESLAASKEGAKKYAPELREQAQAQAESAANESLGTALVDAQNRPKEETTGRVSDEFLTSKAKTQTERVARGAKIAQMMAKLRAPNDLRQEESIDNADTVSRIGGLSGDARNVFRGGQVDASGVTPDGRAAFAGDIAKAGAGYAARRGRTSSTSYGSGRTYRYGDA